MNSEGGFDAFFATKEEAKYFDYLPIIEKLKADTYSHYKNRVNVEHIRNPSSYYRGWSETIVHIDAAQTYKIVDER